jgi:hypothetical protein
MQTYLTVRYTGGLIFTTGALSIIEALTVAQSFTLAGYGVTLRRA